MVELHSEAQVRFTTLKPAHRNPTRDTVTSGGLASVSDFFEDCQQWQDLQAWDDEPPQKRARFNSYHDSGDLTAKSSYKVEHSPGNRGSHRRAIPIARLILNLTPFEIKPPVEKQTFDPGQPRAQLDKVPAGIIEFHQNRYTQGISLKLDGSQSYAKSSQLEIICEPLAPEDVHRFSQIAYLEKRARRKVRDGVAQASCELHRLINADGTAFSLVCTVLWLDGESAFGPLGFKDNDWQVLTTFHPEPSTTSTPPWTPQEFYNSVHSPPSNLDVPQEVQPKVLETELYPFQKRAVTWMLDRERMVDKDSNWLSFSRITDIDGHGCYISHLQGVVASSATLAEISEPRGGILAEEMGLGKTCELIALVCLNKRSQRADSISGVGTTKLRPSKATLIVTPSTILQQWKDELGRHAPGLSVLHYTGVSDLQKSKKRAQSILDDLADRDVVVTTYNVLAREVHFAVDPPERNMRKRTKQYERPKSPLVQMHWWRVCLDEAQMVESGVSAAAQVASLLPRENAWAISGTPLRKNVQDLFGLLVFLRYSPFCDSTPLWTRLINRYRDEFKELFGRIALRHTKDKVREELRLPPQRRVVLTISFTTVEDQNYKTLFEEMCADCGCSSDGAPLRGDWDPDAPGVQEKMRQWLVRLRQTCLHPQVGGRNRRALGKGAGPLRTVGQVLEAMIEQNETATRSETKLAIGSQLLRAHIIANAGDDDKRAENALDMYQDALLQAEEAVMECRSDLRNYGMAAEITSNHDDSDDEDDEKAAGKSSRGRLRSNLHSALQMQHACAFFVGTAYFQMKSNEKLVQPDSDEFKKLEELEVAHYDSAKLIRKELLRESASKAEKSMKILERQGKEGILVKQCSALADMDSPGGVENVKIVDKANQLSEILDAQAKLINEWRARVVELLLKPLVDEEEGAEITGEEYETSTKEQDTLYAYQDALRAVVADRSTCLTGQTAPLIDHEMKELMKGARDNERNVHAPELLIKLLTERARIKQSNNNLISVRGLIHEARGIETSLQWHEGSVRAGAEMSIIQSHMKELQAIVAAEGKVAAKLEEALELYRSTMNQRLEFYRQLQYISDMVAPYKEELDETVDQVALQAATTKRDAQGKTLAGLKMRHRFLIHLRDESSQDAERICVICQSSFERGVLTICGHQYCKECIQHWWSQHRTCPVCKRRLNLNDFHDITYKPQELRAQEEVRTEDQLSPERNSSAASMRNGSHSTSIYSDISSETLAQIRAIDLKGSFGTKIDTLARHVLWIRDHDSGAKTVIFSQFRDFLDVLSNAFRQFGIGFSRMGKPGAVDKFRHDASAECFLLDAKTDSSGLNLVNAQYVLLAEPLINTAIELQAIARVHRIGQQRPTTVYMYLISDTVEEAIYDISVTRRLEHMQDRRRHRGDAASGAVSSSSSAGHSRAQTPAALGEAAIDAANSYELQQVPLSKLLVHGKSGGELVASDDLWGCLFSKSSMRRAGNVSDELQATVDGHVRAEAAEGRRQG